MQLALLLLASPLAATLVVPAARVQQIRTGVRSGAIAMQVGMGPSEDDSCYLIDTAEGTKYVCTSEPEELAWMMGLDLKYLKTGPKPDDLDLIECAEEWSHTGTPQWACTAEPPVARGGPEDDACYLVDTDEGTKYVCTSDPTELAWMLGVDAKDLKTGPKPDDLDLIECAEEWSHTGTPQWVCKAEAKETA